MGFWKRLFGGESASRAEPSQAEPSQAELFMIWAVTLIRRHPGVESAEPGEMRNMQVTIRQRNGAERYLYLKNTFLETREQSTEVKREALARLLDMHKVQTPQGWDDAAPALVPVLRTVTFGVTELTQTLVRRRCLPMLDVLLGIDRETTTNYALRDQLATWGRSEAEAFERAFENFRTHVEADSDVELVESPFRSWHVTRNDSYEVSRLALPGYLEGFRGRVAGNPLAIVPHRSLMIIAGDADPETVSRLAQMAEREFNAAPRPVSPCVYTTNSDGEAVPLRLPAQHPQHGLIERGRYLLEQTVYNEQKAQLEERFQREGTDIFVVTYKLYENDGKLFSLATMSESVLSLMPLSADVVVLVSLSGQKPLLVPREELMKIAPECFEAAPEFDPPRVRIIAWPAADKLARLAELAATG